MPHIHEKIDFTIGVFIVHDEKVLLVNTKKYGLWLAPGGHIELDEHPIQAVYREIKEETGLDITLLGERPPKVDGTSYLHAPALMDIHDVDDIHQHVVLIYFATSDTADVTLEEREHSEIKWFSDSELDEPKYKIIPRIKHGARAALAAAQQTQT